MEDRHAGTRTTANADRVVTGRHRVPATPLGSRGSQDEETIMLEVTAVRSYPFGPVDGLVIDPLYFWLQDHEPLARVKLPYGEEGWLLTRYDDVRTALGDPRFSLAEAAVRDVPRLTPQRY